MARDTIERARGGWRELLPHLGVAPRYLVNRHGPCPVCGGRDRFRFDDRDGSGSYFCNQCGPGSGVVLAQRINGWSFREAADRIDELLGNRPALQPAAAAAPKRTDRRARLERILAEADAPELVHAELQRRGLSTVPSALRGHRQLPYYDPDRGFVGHFPAMLGPVLAPDGTLQALHRTYLADVSPRKKLTTPVDTVRGSAVRLFDPGEVLAVAEGIETAIAAHERDGLPVWALISTTIMEAWQPPANVRHVVIYADHDRNYAGHKAAYALAHRLVGERFIVDVEVPPEPDTDWLDVLLTERRAA